jgi:glycine cleavage system H protein
MAKYFTESHEWVLLKEDIATIGISNYAQEELGDIVYVEFNSVGDVLSKGDTFGIVESVKAASDLYSPLSGEVVEVNDDVVNDPSLINKDSFGDGWMIRMKISDESQLNELLTEEEYNEKINP